MNPRERFELGHAPYIANQAPGAALNRPMGLMNHSWGGRSRHTAARLLFVGILSEENSDLQLNGLERLGTYPLSALRVEHDQISLGGPAVHPESS